MIVLRYLLIVLIGYLIGCSNLAYFMARAKGYDIQHTGTGNPGASNTMMLFGWKAGVLVGIHDIGKAILAVWLCSLLFPKVFLVREIAGAACVLGHLFPFYLRFRGGKGFAATIGTIVMLNWRVSLVILAVMVVLVLITDYIVVGTVTTVVSYPVYCAVTHQFIAAAILAAVAIVILIKHRENFVRILNGTEVGLRKATRGEMRVNKE